MFSGMCCFGCVWREWRLANAYLLLAAWIYFNVQIIYNFFARPIPKPLVMALWGAPIVSFLWMMVFHHSFFFASCLCSVLFFSFVFSILIVFHPASVGPHPAVGAQQTLVPGSVQSRLCIGCCV